MVRGLCDFNETQKRNRRRGAGSAKCSCSQPIVPPGAVPEFHAVATDSGRDTVM